MSVTTLPDPALDAAPPLREGRYRLIEVMGEGGMATVYRGVDTRLRVARAIKILQPALAARPKIRGRFEDEARTMARLTHPHIVAVQDVDVEGERVFLVMDLLEGGTLWDWVARHGPMPPRLAVDATLPVLDALAFAHRAGVVHRDVKPQNVLLTHDGVPRLTDFGIARIDAEGSGTRTAAVMGTWTYMPPEQRRSAKEVDLRADLYAVGAMLFALVRGEDPPDLFAADLDPSLLAGLPERLAEVIRAATRYQRDERYPDAVSMGQALLACRSDLPEVPANLVALVPATMGEGLSLTGQLHSLRGTAGSAALDGERRTVAPVVTAPPVVTGPPAASLPPFVALPQAPSSSPSASPSSSPSPTMVPASAETIAPEAFDEVEPVGAAATRSPRTRISPVWLGLVGVVVVGGVAGAAWLSQPTVEEHLPVPEEPVAADIAPLPEAPPGEPPLDGDAVGVAPAPTVAPTAETSAARPTSATATPPAPSGNATPSPSQPSAPETVEPAPVASVEPAPTTTAEAPAPAASGEAPAAVEEDPPPAVASTAPSTTGSTAAVATTGASTSSAPPGRISVQGPISKATLIDKSSGRRHSPGEVPVGDYWVEVRFNGTSEDLRVGSVRIISGFALTMTCNSRSKSCH